MKIKWDERVPGLGIRTNNAGDVWILKYRFESRQILKTIGPCSQIGIDEARAIAASTKWDAKRGIGPEKKPKRSSILVSEFAAQYLEQYAKLHKRSWDKDESVIRQFVIPNWGKKKLCDISFEMVAELYKAIGEKTPTRANRFREVLCVMFREAVRWKYFPSEIPNPAKDHIKFPENEATLTFTDEQMAQIIIEIDKLPPDQRAYFYLLINTGCRKSEILELKWTDIHVKTDSFGKVRVKLFRGLSKNGDPLLIPVSNTCAKLLLELSRNGEYVFPGRFSKTHWKRPDKVWWKIRDLAHLVKLGVTKKHTLHTFRHTFASKLILTQNETLVSKLMNHRSPLSIKRYLHFKNEQYREVIENYASDLFAS